MTIEEERYRRDTVDHIAKVRTWLLKACANLSDRALDHDASKLQEPEASGFMAMAEELKLADVKYGSDEYRAILRKYKDTTIGPHYAANDHHPEYYRDQGDMIGLRAMSLLSIIEMLCDWRATTERMKDGDLMESIRINQERFGYSGELRAILENTARELGMVE